MAADSYPSGIDRADERAHYDVFARLRVITDWPGFADQQRERRQWLRDWLEANTDLSESQLDKAKPVNVCDLPSMGKGEGVSGAQQETCFIAEREAWWNHDELAGQWMIDAKQANRSWLETRRKQVHGEHPNRWRYLSVATKHDPPWSDWKANHNTTTGAKKTSGGGGAGGDWRAASRSWHESHLGITEQPADSNCDTRSDGIRASQDKCANGTWLRYQPWCGVWVFRGLLAGGLVREGDSWMASVASIEDYARQGKGPFRGWTTDGDKADTGDLVVLFGRGTHVGTVQSVSASYVKTWEGNTSSSSGGSQSNGGGSYERDRSRYGDTYGYALVSGS